MFILDRSIVSVDSYDGNQSLYFLCLFCFHISVLCHFLTQFVWLKSKDDYKILFNFQLVSSTHKWTTSRRNFEI